ncbi:MAG TPA: hypothetical protein VIQ29_17945 [Ancylobacter sp.]
MHRSFRNLAGALALSAAGFVAASVPAAAQSIASDMDFRGMTSLRVTASPMTVDSLDCSIESAAMVRELRQQLVSEGVKATDSDAALAVITVLSTRDPNTDVCSSTLMLGAYKKASFFDKDVGWIRTGYVVMWQSAVLVSSPSESHAVQVRDGLAKLGDALMGDWRNANRPVNSASSQ